MPIDQRAERNGRQGVRTPMQEAMTVLDPDTMQPVPWDGETMGEIMFRGNITMKGYLKNPQRDRRGVRRRLVPHRRPRGDAAGRLREDPRPVEGHHHLRRREHFLDRGGGGAVPPSRGAERRRGGAAGCEMGRDAVRVHRTEAGRHGDRGRTAGSSAASTWRGFKVPKSFVFGDLPKTSTGKIQKFALRELAKSASAIE